MSENSPGTFTQLRRRDQFVECATEAIAELGFAGASVAEVARRAGVSKGVVTYHFPAKDDLIRAVIADVLASMREYLEPLLLSAEPLRYPERFVRAHISAWTQYYRTHARQVLALVRIYNAFRDDAGRPAPAFAERAEDVAILTRVLKLGQAAGSLGTFDAGIMAAVIKAALDDLLTQYTDNPALDLETYAEELAALFERATRPAPGPASGHPDHTVR
jgi:TetR/AcrR family fatty acid metabolism transcriptional regulator